MPSWNSIKIRPAEEFFARGRFSIPKADDLGDRLSVNLKYYSANYLIIILVTLIAVCLYCPPFIIGLVLSIGLGYFLFVVRRHKPLVINGKSLNRFQTLASFVILSVALFAVTGGITALSVFAVSSLLSFLHACLRMRSLKSKGTTFVRGLGSERDRMDDPMSVAAGVASFIEADDTTDDDGSTADEEMGGARRARGSSTASSSGSERDDFELAEKQAKLRAQYLADKRSKRPTNR